MGFALFAIVLGAGILFSDAGGDIKTLAIIVLFTGIVLLFEPKRSRLKEKAASQKASCFFF